MVLDLLIVLEWQKKSRFFRKRDIIYNILSFKTQHFQES